MFCAVQRGRVSVNRILNLCLSVSIFLPLAGVGAGMPRAASWWDWHWRRGRPQGSKFSSTCLAEEEYRESLVLPSPWRWGSVGWERGRVRAFLHVLREMGTADRPAGVDHTPGSCPGAPSSGHCPWQRPQEPGPRGAGVQPSATRLGVRFDVSPRDSPPVFPPGVSHPREVPP